MMMMKILLASILVLGWPTGSAAQQTIRFSFSDFSGNAREAEGLLRVPPDGSPRKAVIILHHAGGWQAGTTLQYGQFLEQHGFVTLEVRMFDQRPDNPQLHLAQVFGALRYLGKHPAVDPSQISIMGLSYGGALALYAATTWAHDKYNPGGVKPRSFAALYPTCFFHQGIASGDARIIRRMSSMGFPPSFYAGWIRSPIRIYIGGEDDYESRDPTACDSFVKSLSDEDQRKLMSVKLFPSATHGWDHGRTFTFYEPLACKWTGCQNTNRYDPQVTDEAKSDLLDFLR